MSSKVTSQNKGFITVFADMWILSASDQFMTFQSDSLSEGCRFDMDLLMYLKVASLNK